MKTPMQLSTLVLIDPDILFLVTPILAVEQNMFAVREMAALAALLSYVDLAFAQSPAWGQCKFTYLNKY